MSDIISGTASQNSKSATIAWVAFGLSLAGFISAIIPGLSFFAWILILAAFVVSIIALAKKQKKGLSVISLILSIVSGIVAVVVSLATLLAVGAGAVAEVEDKMNASADEIQGGIGQVVTTEDGLAVLLNSVECGATEYEGTYSTETATGEFCVADFNLTNNGEEAATLFTSNFGALVGETAYDSVNTLGVGGFGKDLEYSIDLNPGLSIDGVVVIDVPAGTELDAVTFADMFGEEIAIASK